jgi:nitrilase
MSTPLLAAVQMLSTDELAANRMQAEALLREAAAAGAGLAVLPENFAVFGAGRHADTARELPQILAWLQALCLELRLWVVAGTLPAAHRPDGVPVPGGRVRAASFLIGADGLVKARYDKIHLFDVDVADTQGRYQESATFEPGDAVVVADTPLGRLGLSVCYDLRFPELYRQLMAQGADIISVPSAFTYVTGEAHWSVLLRARAIENQAYLVGVGQGGRHNALRETWGHSQIIDPWGRVLAERPEPGPGLVLAARDAAAQDAIRQRMPVATHRRLG